MRILLTGSSGRAGSAIAALLAEEHNVVGLDLVPGRFTTHVGSVADMALVSVAVRKVDAIIHTAALHAPDLDRASPEAFVAINVLGTQYLLQEAAEQGVHRFVYSSTTSVYGYAMEPHDQAVWVTEALEPQPRDIYDSTKLEAENLCRAATVGGRVSCVSLRFSRCFPEPDYLVATYRLYRGVDLRDVAEAHRLALAPAFGRFEVFNISARSPFVPEDCSQLFADAAGFIRARLPAVAKAFTSRRWQLPGSIDRVYAIDKAESELGYHPRHNFDEYLTGA
jgi:UDP-glucose 4-epimerase